MATKPDSRPKPNFRSWEWHLSEAFKALGAEMRGVGGDKENFLHGALFRMLSDAREELGVTHQQIFETQKKIRDMFEAAWMEEDEDETTH